MKKYLAICSVFLTMFSAVSCGANSGYDHTDSSRYDSRYDEDGHDDRTDGRHDDAGNYVSDAVDGVKDAGEDLVSGVGDAAGEIVDGFDGEDEHPVTRRSTAKNDRK